MIFAYVIHNSQERIKQFSLMPLTLFLAGRLIYRLIACPLITESRGSIRAIGQEIALRVGDDQRIAFKCRDSALAYYVDTQARARVVSDKMLTDWKYLVSCEGPVEARLLAEFKAHRYTVMLYARR